MKRFERADLASFSVALIWGFNMSVVKDALSTFSPMSFNAVRLLLAGALLLLIARFREGRLEIKAGDGFSLFLFGVLGNTVYQIFFIYSLHFTKAGNVSLLLAMTTVLIAVLSRVLGHERVRRQVWVGIGLSLSGVFLILLESSEFAVGRASVIGDVLVLGSSTCWAVYTVYARGMMQRYSALTFTAITFSFGAAGFALASLPWLITEPWTQVSGWAYLELGFSAIFALVVAYTLWFFAVSRLGSTRTSIYQNLIPFFGVAFAWILLGEAITRFQGLGGAMILGGIYITRRREWRMSRVTAEAAPSISE